MDDDDDLIGRMESRVTSLESPLAHHQHEYDSLNQVVIDHANELGELQRRIDQLQASLQRVFQEMSPTPARDIADEKPPHY